MANPWDNIPEDRKRKLHDLNTLTETAEGDYGKTRALTEEEAEYVRNVVNPEREKQRKYTFEEDADYIVVPTYSAAGAARTGAAPGQTELEQSEIQQQKKAHAFGGGTGIVGKPVSVAMDVVGSTGNIPQNIYRNTRIGDEQKQIEAQRSDVQSGEVTAEDALAEFKAQKYAANFVNQVFPMNEQDIISAKYVREGKYDKSKDKKLQASMDAFGRPAGQVKQAPEVESSLKKYKFRNALLNYVSGTSDEADQRVIDENPDLFYQYMKAVQKDQSGLLLKSTGRINPEQYKKRGLLDPSYGKELILEDRQGAVPIKEQEQILSPVNVGGVAIDLFADMGVIGGFIKNGAKKGISTGAKYAPKALPAIKGALTALDAASEADRALNIGKEAVRTGRWYSIVKDIDNPIVQTIVKNYSDKAADFFKATGKDISGNEADFAKFVIDGTASEIARKTVRGVAEKIPGYQKAREFAIYGEKLRKKFENKIDEYFKAKPEAAAATGDIQDQANELYKRTRDYKKEFEDVGETSYTQFRKQYEDTIGDDFYHLPRNKKVEHRDLLEQYYYYPDRGFGGTPASDRIVELTDTSHPLNKEFIALPRAEQDFIIKARKTMDKTQKTLDPSRVIPGYVRREQFLTPEEIKAAQKEARGKELKHPRDWLRVVSRKYQSPSSTSLERYFTAIGGSENIKSLPTVLQPRMYEKGLKGTEYEAKSLGAFDFRPHLDPSYKDMPTLKSMYSKNRDEFVAELDSYSMPKATKDQFLEWYDSPVRSELMAIDDNLYRLTHKTFPYVDVIEPKKYFSDDLPVLQGTAQKKSAQRTILRHMYDDMSKDPVTSEMFKKVPVSDKTTIQRMTQDVLGKDPKYVRVTQLDDADVENVYFMDKEAYDFMVNMGNYKQYADDTGKPVMDAIRGAYKKGISIWKRGVLFGGLGAIGTGTRNAIDSVIFKNLMTEGVSPADIAKISQKDVYSKYLAEARKTGAISSSVSSGLIDNTKSAQQMVRSGTLAEEAVSYAKDVASKETRKEALKDTALAPITMNDKNPLVKVAARYNEKMEEFARVSLFAKKRMEGYTPEMAADFVRKYHFDYSENAPIDKVGGVPFKFWKWMSRNTALQATNPKAWMTAGRVNRAIGGVNQGKEEDPEVEKAMGFIGAPSTLRLKSDEGIIESLPLGNIYGGGATMNLLDSESGGNVFQQGLAQSDPLIQSIYEITSGKTASQNKPLNISVDKKQQFAGMPMNSVGMYIIKKLPQTKLIVDIEKNFPEVSGTKTKPGLGGETVPYQNKTFNLWNVVVSKKQTTDILRPIDSTISSLDKEIGELERSINVQQAKKNAPATTEIGQVRASAEIPGYTKQLQPILIKKGHLLMTAYATALARANKYFAEMDKIGEGNQGYDEAQGEFVIAQDKATKYLEEYKKTATEYDKMQPGWAEKSARKEVLYNPNAKDLEDYETSEVYEAVSKKKEAGYTLTDKEKADAKRRFEDIVSKTAPVQSTRVGIEEKRSAQYQEKKGTMIDEINDRIEKYEEERNLEIQKRYITDPETKDKQVKYYNDQIRKLKALKSALEGKKQ